MYNIFDNNPSILLKSRIWETLTLLTDADRSTVNIFCAVEVPWNCRGTAMEVPWKFHGSAIEVLLKCKQPSGTATYLPLLTPPLSTVGGSKTARFNNLGGQY